MAGEWMAGVVGGFQVSSFQMEGLLVEVEVWDSYVTSERDVMNVYEQVPDRPYRAEPMDDLNHLVLQQHFSLVIGARREWRRLPFATVT